MGEVDHVMTVDTSRSDETIEFAKEHPEFAIHVTHKIRTINLTFTPEGQKKFTGPQRRWLGSQVREVFKAIYKNVPGSEPRDEFLPGLGDGSLEASQRNELDRLNRQIEDISTTKIRIGLLKRSAIEVWADPLWKALPNAIFERQADVPDLLKNPKDSPDAFIAATDTSFMEDISLISYSLNAGYLGLEKSERPKWLAKYMATEQKNERMKMLRELHFNALANPVIVPLMSSPYTAIVRKPWKMELSELYANNQLWRIKSQ
jgi:hypothetical protein